jgi:maltose alpha-D-glucosyltransferase/alpha-amylase
MQWTAEANGGFSTAPKDRLILPVISDEVFGYREVNVEKQRRDRESLLNWVESACRRRKECPEFGLGACTWIDTGESSVLAHRCEYEGSVVYAVHNVSGRSVNVSLPVDDSSECLHDLMANRENSVHENGVHRMRLEPFGYRWFREERAKRDTAQLYQKNRRLSAPEPRG